MGLRQGGASRPPGVACGEFMRPRRRLRLWSWTRAIFAATATVVLGLFWINFAPPHLGGDSIYVVTSGISMEPRFHTGDLAVLRPAASYQVGEIVGYRSPQFGIVLHRIIGEKEGHFYMKGDNNNFVDSYHPAPSDVVGRLWLHVPKIGRLINTPRNREVGVLVLATGMTGAIGVPIERERRRRRRNARRGVDSTHEVKSLRPPPAPRKGGRAVGVLGAPGQITAFIICVVAIAALTLAAFSFTRSMATTTTENLAYQQAGTWTYSAPARGDVYANSVATTGQPLFTAVAPVAKIGFTYRLTSALPTRVSGRGGIVAVLTSSDGWSHTLGLGPTKAITNNSTDLTGTLNLPAINSYLASIASQTGQASGTSLSYTLTLEPIVKVSGVLGGSPLPPESFNPPLIFSLQSNEAQLNLTQNGAAATLAQLTQPSSLGQVHVSRSVPATLTILGVHPSIATSRRVSLGALLASLVALLIMGIILRRAHRAAESDRIAARYGSILVAVERPSALGEARSVRVASIEDLVRIAEHQGRMILHCEDVSGRDYFVQDSSLTYLYSVYDGTSVRTPTSGVTLATPAPLVDVAATDASTQDFD